MAKRRLVDRWHRRIFEKGGRLGQRAAGSIFKTHCAAARETALGEQSHLVPLLKARILALVAALPQLRRVDLEVEPFEALDACHYLRLGELDRRGRRHRSSFDGKRRNQQSPISGYNQ